MFPGKDVQLFSFHAEHTKKREAAYQKPASRFFYFKK